MKIMTQILKKYSLKIRYTGGFADNSELPLYDGATSIQGIAQALQIATHAYINEEIVSRATALRGATLVLKPARRGSFLFEVVTFIEQYPVTATLTAHVFYDFLKLAFQKATGDLNVEPTTPSLMKNFEKKEPFFDELAETLEGSLQRVHRPIGNDVDYIKIERPRSELVVFNQATRDWVNTRDEVAELTQVTGNITRFNSVTRNGRIFIDQLEKILPFRPDGDFPISRLGLLTWSLHGSNTELPKKLQLDIRYIKSALGDVKRVLISDIQRLEE